MKLRKVKLNEIKPYWRNARNNDKTSAAVKVSIEKYGYNQPIVVDEQLVIIAGHARFRALQDLGFDKIEVIVADLPEDKAKQYRIADNKTHELTSWIKDDLIAELREIGSFDDMKDFFDDKALKEWLEVDADMPEQADIEKLEADKASAGQDDVPLADVICPKCAHTFYVNPKDLKTA